MRGAFVIGPSTAFIYKGKAVDVKQIGRDLNVRYVLEGSVQRGGDRMRVNVQLIDAESGAHLWAERFDKPIADLFDMQDEIVSRLANQLQTELMRLETRRAERAAPDRNGPGVPGHWTDLAEAEPGKSGNGPRRRRASGDVGRAFRRRAPREPKPR